MPIIILEGIDGSGKSTLATHLKDLSPWPARIAIGPRIKSSVFEELVSPLFDVKPDELLIADRWHLSELIYGPLYRNESRIDPEALDEIETVLSSLKALKIVLSPPLKSVSERLSVRGEDFLKPEHQGLVHAAFSGLACQLGYLQASTSDKLTATELLGISVAASTFS